MKKSLLSLFAILLVFLITAETGFAQVIAAPPAPGYNQNYRYRPYGVYNGPGAPFYNSRFYAPRPVYPVYPGYNPYPPVYTYPQVYPFYFGPQVNPYWMPQQFSYPQQVFVCSFRGLSSGLFYTGWGTNTQLAQNYAAQSCANNEGNACVFFSCIIR
jgi:hypothetical protein